MDRQEEVKTKLQRVRTWLELAGLEAVILSSQANFSWLTGGGNSYVYVGDAVGEASLLVTSDRVYLLSNNIELRRFLEEEIEGLPFEVVSWKWYQRDEPKEFVARLCDVSRAASDLGSFGLPPASSGLIELRYTMLPPEIERYRALGAEAAHAVETACRNARPGETELDVAASLAFECRKRDILPLVNLVGGDHRIAHYRHPLPTRTQIHRTMMVALTGRRHGLHISLTRMVSYGPPEADLAARHHAVTAVDTRFNLESRAGIPLREVVSKAIDQYDAEGFPQEWELHHQGGLTGYAGREIFGTPVSGYRLKHGQVLAWNPSITGAKSEDTVLLTENGPEILTHTGDWPEVEVVLPVGRLHRPSILEPIG